MHWVHGHVARPSMQWQEGHESTGAKGLIASVGLGVNFALGDDGARWAGTFHNITLALPGGSVTYFWSADEGPGYRGVALDDGFGYGVATYDTEYVQISKGPDPDGCSCR